MAAAALTGPPPHARRPARRRALGPGELGLAAVQPPQLGLGLEDQRVEHERPGQVGVRVRAGPQPGQLLQALSGRRALHPHHPAYVGRGRADREGQLDRQLVPGRGRALDRSGEPVGHGGPAGGGDPVGRLAVLLGRLDQPVPLQPGQRRVDLPDVQRPGPAGAGLQPRPQLVAVAGAFGQQRQQPVPYRHRVLLGPYEYRSTTIRARTARRLVPPAPGVAKPGPRPAPRSGRST